MISQTVNKAGLEAHGLLNLDHQAPATLRHSCCCDDKGADNDKHTSEDPGLSEATGIQDLT